MSGEKYFQTFDQMIELNRVLGVKASALQYWELAIVD